MQLPHIRMQSGFVQLGLNIRKPVQEIEQPKAELNLRQEAAVLNIQQGKLELSIDASQARSNIGLMTSMQFSDSNASFGRSQLMEAIEQISYEGDAMMRIESGANVIADLAMDRGILLRNGFTPPAASYDEGVDVDIKQKPVVINVERGGMRMDPVIKAPVHKYTPGKVEPYILKWPYLHLEAIGIFVDRSI
ncbi:DUF6470 family protein [Brevibacillus ruminantium]|uniref:DUF6470 family protein n=2 Tax=Brevibacillus ruminantium TaxID=2950604 RepID=A0ABY4WIZ7_9BACL|nr:DUF6470 family protein [Brevibacillus ruminantium]